MLENKCSCTFFEIFFLKWSIPLYDSCSNGGMEVWIIEGRKSKTHLR
jgi:hypothetical protein